MEVICINDKFPPESQSVIPNLPVEDNLYTIRDITRLLNGKTAVWLVEIENPELPHPSGMGTFEPSFNIDRFTDLNGNPVNVNEIKKAIKQPEYVYVEVETQ